MDVSETDNHDNDHNAELSEINLSAYCDESVLELMDNPYNANLNASRLRTDYKYNGFDSSLGTTWIYPNNLPVRQYQFNISRVSLFKNTLVSLWFANIAELNQSVEEFFFFLNFPLA